jgi:hypothetical protein
MKDQLPDLGRIGHHEGLVQENTGALAAHIVKGGVSRKTGALFVIERAAADRPRSIVEINQPPCRGCRRRLGQALED